MKQEGNLGKTNKDDRIKELNEIIEQFKPVYRNLNYDYGYMKKAEKNEAINEEQLQEIIGRKYVYKYQINAIEDLLTDFSSESINLLRKTLLDKENRNLTETIIDSNISFLDESISPNDEQSEALNEINQFYQKGTTYIFEGNPGTGKTEMAMEIARRFYSQGKKILIITGLHEKLNDLLALFIRYSSLDNYENILRYCTPKTEECVYDQINEQLREYLPKQMISKFYNDIKKSIKISENYSKELKNILNEWKNFILENSYNEELEQNPLTELLLLTNKIVFSTDIGVGRYNSIIDNWLNSEIDLIILDESTSSTLTSFLVGARYGKAWLLLIDRNDEEISLDYELLKQIMITSWTNYANYNDDKLGQYLKFEPRLETLSDELSKKWIINRCRSLNNPLKRKAYLLVRKKLEQRIKSPVSFLTKESQISKSVRIFEFAENYRMRENYEKLFEENYNLFDGETQSQLFIGSSKSPVDLKRVNISEIGAFWDTTKLENIDEKDENQSVINSGEANTIIHFLNNFELNIIEYNVSNPFNIMIASNYKTQLDFIKNQWQTRGISKTNISISFSTIGSAKGKDVDLVVWGLTREIKMNQKKPIGALGSFNSLYSILTRPKWGLVIIGNLHTFNRIKEIISFEKDRNQNHRRINNFISRFREEIEKRGSFERIIGGIKNE